MRSIVGIQTLTLLILNNLSFGVNLDISLELIKCVSCCCGNIAPCSTIASLTMLTIELVDAINISVDALSCVLSPSAFSSSSSATSSSTSSSTSPIPIIPDFFSLLFFFFSRFFVCSNFSKSFNTNVISNAIATHFKHRM